MCDFSQSIKFVEILIQFTPQRLTFILSLDAFALFPPCARRVQALEDTHPPVFCPSCCVFFFKSKHHVRFSILGVYSTDSPELNRTPREEASRRGWSLGKKTWWTRWMDTTSVYSISFLTSRSDPVRSSWVARVFNGHFLSENDPVSNIWLDLWFFINQVH